MPEPADPGHLDLPRVLDELARTRPVFHSEADLQHALAWLLHQQVPARRVRLEYRPDIDEVINLDLYLVEPSGRRVAVELKYWTRAVTTTVGDEPFRLRDQAAQDISRYDLVKDITRVERLLACDVADEGWVVALTNDPGYWNPATRPDTIDAAFRLSHGGTLTGRLAWAPHAGGGTTRGRTFPHELRGTYPLRWRDYSQIDRATTAGRFRHLSIHVTEQGRPA